MVVFRLERSRDASEQLQLTEVTKWDHNYFLTSLVVHNDRLVVGDVMHSVAILQLAEDRIHTIAKDYSPLLPVALGTTDGSSVIGANVS